MNQVEIIGRLTKDPTITYGGATNTCISKFCVAVDKDGKDKGTNYINCVAFGKTAEHIDHYCAKGQLVGITGSINTGSYEKDGRRVYTTDVLVNRIEFLSKADKKEEKTPDGFTPFDHSDDIGILF